MNADSLTELCSYIASSCLWDAAAADPGHWPHFMSGVQVMRWMEQCSYIAASRVGRSGHLLTGSMDSLAFAAPTRVGDILYITAQARRPPSPRGLVHHRPEVGSGHTVRN